MRWYRKTFLWMSAGWLGAAAAAAQDPVWYRASPAATDSGTTPPVVWRSAATAGSGIVRVDAQVLTPITPGDAGATAAPIPDPARGTAPRTVVRASGAALADEEPKPFFLPRPIPAIEPLAVPPNAAMLPIPDKSFIDIPLPPQAPQPIAPKDFAPDKKNIDVPLPAQALQPIAPKDVAPDTNFINIPPPAQMLQPVLPKEIGPDKNLIDTPLPPQTLQPIPPQEKAAIIGLDKNGKASVNAESPNANRDVTTDFAAPASSSVPATPDQIVIVDPNGNPLLGYDSPRTARWYGDAGWLFWWTKGFQLPPLITTDSALSPQPTQGALGMNQTRIIFGNSLSNGAPVSGGRFTLGYNFDPCGLCAFETSFFFLGNKNNSFVADSSQFPVLARPFFDINDNVQSRQLTTSPGIDAQAQIMASGSIQVNTSSQLWGAEANLRSMLCCGCNYQISGLAGFRYLNLNEDVSITERILALNNVPAFPGAVPINAGDHITVFDDFHTRNSFYGGQVGINARWFSGRWTFDTRFKIGIGATVQSVDINGGQSILSVNGTRQDFSGGLYALNSNIGIHTQARFAVVPDVGIKVGYNITDNVRVFVGYDFLYWSSVLRPGDQIDQGLDITRIPNSGAQGAGILPLPVPRPIVPFRTTGYWAQGVTAGVEFRY